MEGIDAVLFDFGGVFTPSPFDAMGAMGRELGVAPEVFLEIVFGPYHEDTDHPWHRLERGEIPFTAAREHIIALGAARGVDSDPAHLFSRLGGGAGAREAMVERTRRLRDAGYRTALITNNAREFRAGWERMVPVGELFEVVIDSSQEGVRKPDPRIYRLALERLGGVPAARAIFLDDAASNVEAAERLGMRGHLVEADLAPTLAALDALLARRGG